MKIAAISLNKYGDDLAAKINRQVPIDIYSKNNIKNFNIITLAATLMQSYEAIIFLSSTGIAVRSIASFIKNKVEDPAVIVIDIFGKYVISLLSGHLGGANSLTEKIANVIGAQPIITTATDSLNVTAPDIIAMENGLIIGDMKIAKEISALLVDGKNVFFSDGEREILLPKGYTENLQLAEGIVYVTNKNEDIKSDKNIPKLKLIRKNIVLGIGCKKNYSAKTMINAVKEKLKENNIDERAIKIVTSVEIKKDEMAIIALSKYFNAEFKTFSIEEIKTVQNNYKGSDFVEKSIGVRSVCEPCIELSNATLLTDKMNLSGMTLCIGILKLECRA